MSWKPGEIFLVRQLGFTGLLVFLLTLLGACNTIQKILPASATALASDFTTYTVQPGDTASQIAARYHITIEELIALNIDQYPSLARDPSTLKPGWKLRVPQSSASATEVPQVDLNQATQQIIDGINVARAQQGMALLRANAMLNKIAQDRSNDMIARDYFSHYDPQTEQEPLLRYLQASKYTYRYAGENIAEIKNEAGLVPSWLTVAARYSAVELANEFVKGWLNSPEHRANIFNKNYQKTGVALAVSSDGRRVVATQVFSD